MLPVLYPLTFAAFVVAGVAYLLAFDPQRNRGTQSVPYRVGSTALTIGVLAGLVALALWLAKTRPSLSAVHQFLGHLTVGLGVPLAMMAVVAILPEPSGGIRYAQARGQRRAARFLRWPLLAGATASGIAYLALSPFT